MIFGMMMMPNQIVVLSDQFCNVSGISIATLSNRLFKDARKIEALRSGRDLVTARYQLALAYFDMNWPSDLEWPSDIPRPSVAEENKAPAA